MATLRELEADDYLQKHKIPELIDNITSMLFFHRPERPHEFLITQLENLVEAKLRILDCPCLFDDSNLDSIFGIMDPTKQGHVTLLQYKAALTTLGIENFDEYPEGAALDRICLETFKTVAKEGLLKSSATFKPL